MWEWLKIHKDALASIESLLTSAAIVAGGVWAWKEYRRRRDPNPKARAHLRVPPFFLQR